MTTNPVVISPAPSIRRKWLRPAISGAVSLALVVGIFWFFIPQFTSMSKVWTEIRAMTGLEMATLALAAVWNLATYLFVMVGATPGLKYRQAFVATETSTAVSNTIPGGGALGIALTYSMFGSWGISKSRSTVSVLVSGIWNNFAKLAMPVLALALLALQGNTTP
ncbi:MAG: putative heme transporter, partial [Pseudonocardiales bacterium]|nr:putative heme transporter [Pseudonocardiales bacterium]